MPLFAVTSSFFAFLLLPHGLKLFTPSQNPIPDLALAPLLCRFIKLFLHTQVFLCDKMVGMGMRVLLVLAMAKPLGTLVMTILEVYWNGNGFS